MKDARSDNFIVSETPQSAWDTLIRWILRRKRHPIRPNMIRVDRHLWNTFGKYEAETTAYWLVCYAQSKDCWTGFTQAEIDQFSKHDFHFNGLAAREFILFKDDRYYFTHEFICRCFITNPKD